MSSYYKGRRAQHYNTRWRTFTTRTLTEVVAMVDIAALRRVPERFGRSARVLDVACGTGILLKQLIAQVPDVEAYGVDASADMLAQAHAVLDAQAHVQLEQAEVGPGERANLSYPSQTFDLITCTNTLHDLSEPEVTLAGLKRLLAPEGQLVVEDYARRRPPFPWLVFAWLLRRVEGTYVQAYTRAEAQSLCIQAGLRVLDSRDFTINWLWHGWVLRTSKPHEISSMGVRKERLLEDA